MLTYSPVWSLPGKSVNMLFREISEKGVKFLQNPRTEKPGKGDIFQYICKYWKEVLYNAAAVTIVMVNSQRKGLLSTNQIREKGLLYAYNLRENGTSRTFLTKQAYTFNQEWQRRD